MFTQLRKDYYDLQTEFDNTPEKDKNYKELFGQYIYKKLKNYNEKIVPKDKAFSWYKLYVLTGFILIEMTDHKILGLKKNPSKADVNDKIKYYLNPVK